MDWVTSAILLGCGSVYEANGRWYTSNPGGNPDFNEFAARLNREAGHPIFIGAQTKIRAAEIYCRWMGVTDETHEAPQCDHQGASHEVVSPAGGPQQEAPDAG